MRTPIVAFLICFGLTAACVFVQGFGSPVTDIAWFCAMMSLFVVPIVEVRYLHRRDEVEAGITVSCSKRDWMWGLGAIALLLIPVALGNHLLRAEIFGQAFHFDWHNYARLDEPFYYEVLVQLFGVALPEEFFYRGYLQTSFLKIFQSREKMRRFAPAISVAMASLLFALAHLPSGGIGRMMTFFPGLLFGFLRHKSGGIVAPILCHAACNLMMVAFNVHYF